jgi:hypothetical protein
MAKATGWMAFALCALLAGSGCATTSHQDTASTNSSSASTDATGVDSDRVRAGPRTLSFSDPRGDLVSASKEADWFEGARPVPEQEWGDIIGTRVQHSATEIRVRVRFVDLHPRAQGHRGPLFRLSATIKTNPTGIARDVELWSHAEGPALPATQMLLNGEPVSCHLAHSIDLNQDIATMRVPRSCLGNPQRVFVSVSCLAYPDGKTMTLDLASVGGYDTAREDALSPPIQKP